MRIVLEIIAVMCFLGAFAFSNSVMVKILCSLAIFVIAVTSDLTKTSGGKSGRKIG